jgi:hypothetical protein
MVYKKQKFEKQRGSKRKFHSNSVPFIFDRSAEANKNLSKRIPFIFCHPVEASKN